MVSKSFTGYYFRILKVASPVLRMTAQHQQGDQLQIQDFRRGGP
jgi:hypothetical protein